MTPHAKQPGEIKKFKVLGSNNKKIITNKLCGTKYLDLTNTYVRGIGWNRHPNLHLQIT